MDHFSQNEVLGHRKYLSGFPYLGR